MLYHQNLLIMKTIRINQKFISNLGTVLFMPLPDMIAATFKNHSTWYRVVKNPAGITIQQLLTLANGLHIPVSRFFSTGSTDIIGQRSDYITDPYTPCFYDASTLRRLMETHQDATWKKASDATGVTRDNLRNSLMGETRTPVARFLSVCQVFDINPFAILIDPNPSVKHNKRDTSTKRSDRNEGLRSEMNALREDVHRLAAIVEDLTAKYEALLKSHEALANRFSVNIDTVNGGYIGIAAESASGYGVNKTK